VSLGVRVGAALALLVAVTLGLSWTVVNRAVVKPFSQELRQAFLDEAIHVARQVQQGTAVEDLEQELGLDLELLPGPRPSVDASAWVRTEHRGRKLLLRRSDDGAEALVRIKSGWVRIARPLDLQGPQRLMLRGLGVAGLLVLLCSWLLTRMAGRPLEQAATAMQHMADGDLSHRLEERGAPELRSAARSFNAMADRVERMLEAERRLMAGISHELRTPLTRLRLELELLREGLTSEARLAAMEGDLGELDVLVGEMLASSRLQLGAQRLVRTPIALHDLAADAIAAMPLPDHDVVLEGTGSTLHLDGTRMRRVLTNLLQNAGKYAPAGSRVTVRVEDRSIAVADEGPGVPEEALVRLFEPFYRADPSRSRATGGSGLGLMIARQVVELHGGRIRACNRTNGGLVIVLTLPEQSAREG